MSEFTSKQSDNHQKQSSPDVDYHAEQLPAASPLAMRKHVTPDDVMRLQSRIGNMAVQRLLQTRSVIPRRAFGLPAHMRSPIVQRSLLTEYAMQPDLPASAIEGEQVEDIEDAINELKAYLETQMPVPVEPVEPLLANLELLQKARIRHWKAEKKSLSVDETDPEYAHAKSQYKQAIRDLHRSRAKFIFVDVPAFDSRDSEEENRERVEKLMGMAIRALETEIPYPDMVDSFIAQAEPDNDEKVRVLGEAAAAFGRLNFLLGTLYHKGAKNWETGVKKEAEGATGDKGNRGPYVDRFVPTWAQKRDKDSGQNWCAWFATTTLNQARGDASLRKGSGYKVANSVGKGEALDTTEDYGGDFAGTRNSREAIAEEGNKHYSAWAELRENLEKLESPDIADAELESMLGHSIQDMQMLGGLSREDLIEQAKRSVVDAFTSKHIEPQAGDIMDMRTADESMGSANSFVDKGKPGAAFASHTTMVEKYTNRQIHTVEGNTDGGRVSGRVLDLTKSADVAKIIFVARASLLAGRSDEEQQAIKDGTFTGPAGEEITEEMIVVPIQSVNSVLEGLANDAGYTQASSDGSGSVASIKTG